MVDKAVKRIVT